MNRLYKLINCPTCGNKVSENVLNRHYRSGRSMFINKSSSEADATDKLYKAVVEYVKIKGGNVVVFGGVQLIQMPNSLKYNWTLGIPCTGVPPRKDGESADQV